MRNHNPLIALLAAVGLLFGAHFASAQVPAEAPGASDVQVSSEDVGRFAQAYLDVQTINQEYSERMQATDDQEQAAELQQKAQTEMQEAVTGAGLSIADYQRIAEQANQDEELREDIQQAVTAMIDSMAE